MKSWGIYSLFAFALSLWLLQFGYFIGDDGAYYARIGASLIAGNGICANPNEPYLIHPPFYPLLIGLFHLIFKDLEFSAHLVSILAFSLTLIPLFYLVEDIDSKNAAHWTSLLYVTNGYLLIHSNLVMADTVFTLLVMTQLYLIHRIIQGKSHQSWLGILIGAVTGMAYLTRPEGAIFYGVGVLAIFLLAQAPRAFKFRLVLLSLFTFLLFFLPYLHFVYQKSHKFQLSRGITEIFIKREMEITHPDPERYFEIKKIREGLTEDKKRLKMDELVEEFNLFYYLTKDHFKLLRSALGSMVWRFLELNQYLFGGLGFFLIGASWLSAPWRERRRKSELLLLLFLSTFSLKLLCQFLPRYFFHYFPIFLIWMGGGVEVLRNWVSVSFRLSQRTSKGIVWGICLLLAVPSAWYLHRVLTQFPMPFEYKELGLWMKRNIPGIEAEGIASRQPAVSFYSGARILKLPYVDRMEDLFIFLNHQRAHYFVVADDLDRPHQDAYQFLLDESKPLPPSISRIHTVRRERKVMLFKAR